MKRIFITSLLGVLGMLCCLSLNAQDDRFAVLVRGKLGFIDHAGKLVLQTNIESPDYLTFKEGLAAFETPYVDKSGQPSFARVRFGFIDTHGAVVIAPQFDDVDEFSESLAGVAFDTDQTNYNCLDCERSHIWGFINKQGRMVVAPQYQHVSRFSEGLAAVQDTAGKWGYIDSHGRVVIPTMFKDAGDFNEGLAAVYVNELGGYINRQGLFVIKPQFARLGPFSEGLAAVRRGGSPHLPPGSRQVMIGRDGGRWSFVRKDGSTKVELDQNIDWVEKLSEGFAVVRGNQSRCGYVNSSGAIVVSPRYYHCGDFSEGLAAVFTGSSDDDLKWQFIDKKGSVTLTVPYSGKDPSELNVDSFNKGLARLTEEKKYADQKTKIGYIDKRGNQVWKLQ